jgi:hypothetical protein
MSKHKTAEEKLHVSKNLRPTRQNLKTIKPDKSVVNPPAPPVGTNSKNQFR